MGKKNISVYISYLLRHNPMDIGLEMDEHGWVSVDAMITGINEKGKYAIDPEKLEYIVEHDDKGRYRFSEDHTKIKACQGHSVPWVQPQLEKLPPPKYLYHGTTKLAVEKILESGAISKMSRHAVHMQEELKKAWKSAVRWHQEPVVLKINAEEMSRTGYSFGKTENDVWCTECVPAMYIVEQITELD